MAEEALALRQLKPLRREMQSFSAPVNETQPYQRAAKDLAQAYVIGEMRADGKSGQGSEEVKKRARRTEISLPAWPRVCSEGVHSVLGDLRKEISDRLSLLRSHQPLEHSQAWRR